MALFYKTLNFLVTFFCQLQLAPFFLSEKCEIKIAHDGNSTNRSFSIRKHFILVFKKKNKTNRFKKKQTK